VAPGGAGTLRRVEAAVVQFAAGLDPAVNRDRAVAALTPLVADGVGLVVLPEASQCGFGDPGTDVRSRAEPLDGPFVGALGAAVSGSGTTVVAGMFEAPRPGDDPGRAHNTVVVVGPGGLVAAYRKLHLFDALGWRESEHFAPGAFGDGAPVTVEVAGMTVGIITCYDLRFPELARALVDAGATVLAVPANWVAGPGKADVFTTLVRARAIESTAYVLAAAKPAPDCAGSSMIVDPLGVVLGALGESGEGVRRATLTPGRVDEVRRVLPVLEHRRFDVRPRG
jgi:predicted amidohydrolase